MDLNDGNDRYNEILDVICGWANKHNIHTWERYASYQELAAMLDESGVFGVSPQSLKELLMKSSERIMDEVWNYTSRKGIVSVANDEI